MATDEWDKYASVSFVLLEARVGAVNNRQVLVARRPDRHDEPSTGGELILQQRGDSRCAGGHQDAVERRCLGNTLGSVTDSDVDIRNPKLVE